MQLSMIQRVRMLNGLFFILLFAATARYLAGFSIFTHLGISPLIIGILIGMIYGNTLRGEFPAQWMPGVLFSSRTLLRLGIVLYGFQITLQDVLAVGPAGMGVSISIVVSTFIAGSWIGVKWLKLDLHTAMLTSVGTAVCGAAAVLATEPLLRSEPHKSAIAVSTVVLFGTLCMFAYPLLYAAGVFGLSPGDFGIYIGGTIHEVAHAVAAGNGVSAEAANTAVIVKMIRVMMIAPLLILLSLWLGKQDGDTAEGGRRVISVPWFALAFIGVVLIHSLNAVPEWIVAFGNETGQFLLAMAMCALGMESNLSKFKGVGMAPVYLAFILFVWVTCGGYLLTRVMTQIF